MADLPRVSPVHPSGRVLQARKLSYDEFLAWCDEDTWAEWANGEVVVVSPASDCHQDLPVS